MIVHSLISGIVALNKHSCVNLKTHRRLLQRLPPHRCFPALLHGGSGALLPCRLRVCFVLLFPEYHPSETSRELHHYRLCCQSLGTLRNMVQILNPKFTVYSHIRHWKPSVCVVSLYNRKKEAYILMILRSSVQSV